MTASAMKTAVAAGGLERVEWVGSRTCAPGPGALTGDVYRLFGVVERVSPADPDSIKVRWANGRVTIERRRNLVFS